MKRGVPFLKNCCPRDLTPEARTSLELSSPLSIGSSATGSGLVAVLIGMAMVALAAVALAGLMANMRVQESRLDRRSLGMQVMMTTALGVTHLSFDQIFQWCGLNSSVPPLGGLCTLDGGATLNTQTSPDCASYAFLPLNVRRRWTGECDSQGPVCVELDSCLLKGGGKILEVTLKGWWTNPSAGKPLIARFFTIRKSEW